MVSPVRSNLVSQRDVPVADSGEKNAAKQRGVFSRIVSLFSAGNPDGVQSNTRDFVSPPDNNSGEDELLLDAKSDTQMNQSGSEGTSTRGRSVSLYVEDYGEKFQQHSQKTALGHANGNYLTFADASAIIISHDDEEKRDLLVDDDTGKQSVDVKPVMGQNLQEIDLEHDRHAGHPPVKQVQQSDVGSKTYASFCNNFPTILKVFVVGALVVGGAGFGGYKYGKSGSADAQLLKEIDELRATNNNLQGQINVLNGVIQQQNLTIEEQYVTIYGLKNQTIDLNHTVATQANAIKKQNATIVVAKNAFNDMNSMFANCVNNETRVCSINQYPTYAELLFPETIALHYTSQQVLQALGREGISGKDAQKLIDQQREELPICV